MKIRKTATVCIMIFFLFAGICEAASKDISDGIVRLHIIANSNGTKDQRVKLLVRDEIIKMSKELSEDGVLTLQAAEENKNAIENLANSVLKNNGCDYTCHVETGNFHFPTKQYENITLPGGNYNAVRIILGEGAGENWWCVMYPPLCFTTETKGEMSESDKEKLSCIINDESIVTVPAVKAIEIWDGIKQKFFSKS